MRAALLFCAVLSLIGLVSAPLNGQKAPERTVPLAARRATAPAERATPAPAPAEIKARLAAHKGDFDYLLGDWEFASTSKQYGKGFGFWSAVRLAGDGQVLDEYRIVGDSGQTFYVTSTLRSYNALQDRWELVSVGNPNGLQDLGTGRRVGDEMHLEQTFGAGGPNPSRLRIRYYNIQPDRFSWNADCSLNGGKTWISDCNHIEARRIGPARSLAPLAGAGKVK